MSLTVIVGSVPASACLGVLGSQAAAGARHLLFEGKLLLGTAGFVGAGWLVYRRNAAVSSSNVISPG